MTFDFIRTEHLFTKKAGYCINCVGLLSHNLAPGGVFYDFYEDPIMMESYKNE